MLLVYILLSIIAVGVLLISPAGQRLLEKIGVTAFVLVIIGLIVLLIIGGVSLVSNNWQSIKEFAGGILILIGLLVAWVIVLVVIPTQSNKLLGKWLKNPEHRKTFWAWFFVIVFGFLIYYLKSI